MDFAPTWRKHLVPPVTKMTRPDKSGMSELGVKTAFPKPNIVSTCCFMTDGFKTGQRGLSNFDEIAVFLSNAMMCFRLL